MEKPKGLKGLQVKLITKVQKLLLRFNNQRATNLYYYLAKLHFKIYTGLVLEEEVLNNTEIGYIAAKRHGRLVLKVLYKDSSQMARKVARYASRGSFIKNILLGSKL